MWDGHDGMGWWMLFGSIWFVIFWGLIIWGVATVVSKVGGHSGGAVGDDSPLEHRQTALRPRRELEGRVRQAVGRPELRLRLFTILP